MKLNPVLQNLLSVGKISFIVTFLISTYLLTLLYGYSKGQESISLEPQTSYASVASTPTLSVSSPAPTKVIQKSPQIAKWDGPALWDAVNARRIELGVNPLGLRTELCTIASLRLNQLLELGKLDGHIGFSALKDTRPDIYWIFELFSNTSEFLALGGDSPAETVSMWENTMGHSKLIKGGEYTVGCIYAQETFAVAIAAY